MKATSQTHFLQCVPMKNPACMWTWNSNHLVTLSIVHRGVYAFLAQKLFGRPKVSRITLDQYGSFVWDCINRENSVQDISDLLWRQYGKEVEPVTERLVQFFQILLHAHLVLLAETTPMADK